MENMAWLEIGLSLTMLVLSLMCLANVDKSLSMMHKLIGSGLCMEI